MFEMNKNGKLRNIMSTFVLAFFIEGKMRKGSILLKI